VVAAKQAIPVQENKVEQSAAGKRPFRLAVVASHVIQYQDPLYQLLAKDPALDLEVFFCSDWGAKPFHDPGFGQELKWDIELLHGYRHEFLKNISPNPSLTRFFGTINPGITRRLKKGGFDAVLLYGWNRCTMWIAFFSALLFRIPILLRGETNLINPLPWWKRSLKRAVLAPMFRGIRAFLAIGTKNLEFYHAYGIPARKLFVAPYAINNEFFMSRARELQRRRDDIRRRLGIPDGSPTVIFCGKLIGVKRPMDLLQAFARTDFGGTLIFVGDGTLRPELEEYVSSNGIQNVHIAGFKNQTELPGYFAAGDIFALPSVSEPWGLVVNEAMCFGLPIVVSDKVGAAADLVKEGENGFVFRCGDIEQLASLLSRTGKDPELRTRMGQKSTELISRWSYAEDREAVVRCLNAVARRGK